MKAYRSFPTFQSGTNCRAWLFQICRNTYISGYQRKKLEPMTVDLSDEWEETRAGSSGESSRVPRMSVSDERDLRAHDCWMGDEALVALRELPDGYQTAVILSDIEGLPYAEIAEFMRVPVGTIRSRIHRGRQLLAQRLAGYARHRGWEVAAIHS